ncbi:SulP family inorganic anion transporter [Aminobacter sp. P9b]|uniref:SulP family sulfate permease n=1 Tax=Aminobacter ciceronei TaxID=150723 RepID=A0ABR6CC79_9HYPH|nr:MULTISPECIES: SulP family inorganic anion transporter [Aminobacter]MBA8908260.1 SulP family sulfate permease [Aminobacter ciceronei]MBA9022032.1 SulP family sulfate permease [Aminobacter ciceronei]QNH34822.1 SulP family inorganic anion transporter [Aminobacter sp. MDW-2]WMC97359.1 SulP family inorganic anion transporter [Aminobacter aminovorans]
MKSLFPFLDWMRLVDKRTLQADTFAGFTNAAVVLPQAIAFAAIAGLPPEYGLYSAVVIPIVAALYGSSWHQISGPSTAISLVVFATLSPVYQPGSAEFIAAAMTVSLLVGAFQFLLGIARLGQLMNFVSPSVMMGFTAGAAVLIGQSQIATIMEGLTTNLEHDRLSNLDSLVFIAKANYSLILVVLVTLVSSILLRRLLPKWPSHLIALILGGAVAYLMHARAHGVEFVEPITFHLPPFRIPEFSAEELRSLAPGSFAIALIGLLQTVSISRAIAGRSRQHIDTNREIIGQGLSNLVGSLFSSYAGSGSLTRSGLNYDCGARTPLSAILSSLFLLGMIAFIAPLVHYLPIPAMSGLIILIAWRLVEFEKISHVLRTSPPESMVLVCTFLAVLFLEMEFAIFLGVILSLCFFLRRTMQTDVPLWVPNPKNPHRSFANAERAKLPECPQAIFSRLQGPLYFGALEGLQRQFRRLEQTRPHQTHMVMGIDGNIGMDLSGAEFLIEEAKRRKARGGGLYLIVKYPRLRQQLSTYRVAKEIGRGHVFRRKSEAIPGVVRHLDPVICAACRNRIFLECPKVPASITQQTSQPLSEVAVSA